MHLDRGSAARQGKKADRQSPDGRGQILTTNRMGRPVSSRQIPGAGRFMSSRLAELHETRSAIAGVRRPGTRRWVRSPHCWAPELLCAGAGAAHPRRAAPQPYGGLPRRARVHGRITKRLRGIGGDDRPPSTSVKGPRPNLWGRAAGRSSAVNGMANGPWRPRPGQCVRQPR